MKISIPVIKEPLHSKLGASSMHRWTACPGSVRLCSTIPYSTNVWAEEGTKAHFLAEQAFKGADLHKLCPNNVVMREAVELYVDTVMGDYTARKTNPRGGKPDHLEHLWIEKKFDLSAVYPKCFGTADATLWDEKPRILRVYDLKYGTDPVDAKDNVQELYYALGALKTLELPAKDIELVIVQPRARRKKKVDRWMTDIVRLMDFEEELIEACKRTEPKNAPLVVGRHCYWCPAKSSCQAHKDAANLEAASVFGELPSAENLAKKKWDIDENDDFLLTNIESLF